MNNFETAGVGGLAFDGHHVHIFCESGIYKDVHDVVRSVCREDIRLLHGYNDVGLADVPLIDVAELPWRRHIRRVAHGRAGVDPLADRGNFCITQ